MRCSRAWLVVGDERIDGDCLDAQGADNFYSALCPLGYVCPPLFFKSFVAREAILAVEVSWCVLCPNRVCNFTRDYAVSFSMPQSGYRISVCVQAGRVLARRKSCRIFIKRWIHDRGPSFHSQNVIDDFYERSAHQRQQFVPVTCQSSLIRLSLAVYMTKSQTAPACHTVVTVDNVWKQSRAEGCQSRFGC